MMADNRRLTRAMARALEADDKGRSESGGDGRPIPSGSMCRATESAKRSPSKKCLTKNQLLMTTPGSLGRSNVKKSFIKQSASKTDVKEREQLKWDALNKKTEQENERKKKIEERRKKQEEMKRKCGESLKRFVEARVKAEKKEQKRKKKLEEKLALLEKKNDMLRVERMAEEKAKRKVATKRVEQRRKREEAARQKKLQVQEEERTAKQAREAQQKPIATDTAQQSPQSYQITPEDQKMTTLATPEDHGMDQNSDDSTDDESVPRKPIPSCTEDAPDCKEPVLQSTGSHYIFSKI